MSALDAVVERCRKPVSVESTLDVLPKVYRVVHFQTTKHLNLGILLMLPLLVLLQLRLRVRQSVREVLLPANESLLSDCIISLDVQEHVLVVFILQLVEFPPPHVAHLVLVLLCLVSLVVHLQLVEGLLDLLSLPLPLHLDPLQGTRSLLRPLQPDALRDFPVPARALPFLGRDLDPFGDHAQQVLLALVL